MVSYGNRQPPETMKKKTAFLLPALALAATLAGSRAQETPPAPAPAPAPPAPAGAIRLTGPFTHKNLAVYLVHAPDQAAGTRIDTLREAMEKKSVVVHETGRVNQLLIENKSPDTYLFIHAGDIVKGGKQDRTLSNSFVLAPASKPLPVESLCVEHARWARRGGEQTGTFSESNKSVNSKALKIASRGRKKDQGKVWKEVAKSQEKLSRNIGKKVNSEVSETSLQLALEDKDLARLAKEYTEAIARQIPSTEGVTGYAFAINGEFNSADAYLHNALFRKLWAQRLEAAASEAIAELTPREKPVAHPASEAVLALLQAAGKPRPATEKLPGGNTLQTRETPAQAKQPGTLLFDSLYEDTAWRGLAHRNTLTTQAEPETPAPAVPRPPQPQRRQPPSRQH